MRSSSLKGFWAEINLETDKLKPYLEIPRVSEHSEDSDKAAVRKPGYVYLTQHFPDFPHVSCIVAFYCMERSKGEKKMNIGEHD